MLSDGYVTVVDGKRPYFLPFHGGDGGSTPPGDAN